MKNTNPDIIKAPQAIESQSMRIIDAELKERGIILSADREHIVKRVIHATADFDFTETLIFSENAPEAAEDAVRRGTSIVTDTNMTLAGLSKPAMEKLGTCARCFMADPAVAEQAKKEGVTRAIISVRKMCAELPHAVFAAGNAPTALFELAEEIKNGYRPSLVIGVPVGFVNVVEAKELIRDVCEEYEIPAIIAMGRKGGSTVSCAILNAVLYHAVSSYETPVP